MPGIWPIVWMAVAASPTTLARTLGSAMLPVAAIRPSKPLPFTQPRVAPGPSRPV
jgi:hypothetical protein